MNDHIVRLRDLGLSDIDRVGGKNASLGEMIHNLAPLGVQVPGGFATTAHAFNEFMAQENLAERINAQLKQLDVDDVNALAAAGAEIRGMVTALPFPAAFDAALESAYADLIEEYGNDVTWAVRSSATAEDLPDASFAGQQETYLNVHGLEQIRARIKDTFASLFNDRAIAYRVHQGFEHADVALSAGVQKMVRSDIAASGVMFTLDTESGFRDVVFITGSYGLGEMVVQGAVNPDEFFVYKPALEAGRPALLRRTVGAKTIKMVYANDAAEPVKVVDVAAEEQHHFCLSDAELDELARQALVIEKHYDRPMDIEWAKDGVDGKLYIVQARPETVQSRTGQVLERYSITERAEVLTEGRSIGHKIGAGTARVIASLRDMDKVQPGDVLVTDMTDPDWEPIMKRASAIVTNRGGRTCHAAIIARELGVPAVVGCGDATDAVADGTPVTVSCSEGDTGYVYGKELPFEVSRIELDSMPEIPVKVMMNVGNPERAFASSRLPHHGVGLARLEFIINNMIGVHPQALLDYETLPDDLKGEIEPRIAGYDGPRNYFIRRLAEGVASIAAAFHPHPVIVRTSDFKSNEYANLIAGDQYEPDEENPMLGFRGVSRYLSEDFRECFAMECEALKFVRNDMGLRNVAIMVPFVRTLDEAAGVVRLLADNGLERGKDDLRLYMMFELPANAMLAEEFLEYFDGFSIGSNDLTQLTLGLDRDSGLVAQTFDERNPAVKKLLAMGIEAAQAQGKYVGICGQGPSDHPDLAEWLVERGISSVSLNPDTVVDTWLRIAGQSV
jgi:pyruvate,water dikinase